ncbi:putative fluoride ion transporter CrcB 2 [Galliscardovia ingluviei]|uniref:Fluoride-specific ion channel FluC n=1 Tax=Galliscardovia ingluviei TaxID=1769422 RepID=A0A8J3EX30_9BIFI|nr:CrcB family protein [Galliscardovia ingluviei]GGI14615.1 putative fluoride ion transporter CrcB 2 [Galliscardovia ingluviei]
MSKQSHEPQESPLPKPTLLDPMLYVVVFLGGALGTGIRFGLSAYNADIYRSADPLLSGLRNGTLEANLFACLLYAALTAYLAGAPWIANRSKTLASRGLGMGMCGGLSTMSTLALEWFTTSATDHNMPAAAVYAGVTLIAGLIMAAIGVWFGSSLAQWQGLRRETISSNTAREEGDQR